MQAIEFRQIRILHIHLCHWPNHGGFGNQFSYRIDIKSHLSGQQMSQCIRDRLLTFIRCQMQQFDIESIGHFLGMSRTQIVPRHAKTTGRKHFFAIPITRKCSRLSHQ
jgi:hypothetical protein